MPFLHIEHPVTDFDAWHSNFSAFDEFRMRSGVRSYRITRGVVDTTHVAIDLEFDTADRASAMLAALPEHWRSLEGTLIPRNTTPRAYVADVVGAWEYQA